MSSFLPTDAKSDYYKPGILNFLTIDLQAPGLDPPLIEGTWEEDLDVIKPSFDPLSNYCYDSHYWDPKNQDIFDKGMSNCNNALRDALEPLVNNNASEPYKGRWAKAVYYYRANNLPEAYYWLGRTAHLLMDMSVPAHTLLDAHGLYLNLQSTNSYERYTGVHYTDIDWTSPSPNTDIPIISELNSYSIPNTYSSDGGGDVAKLFYNLAQISNDFDSDNKPGEKDTGNFNYYPGKNDISATKEIQTIELISFWGTLQATGVLGVDYEIDDSNGRSIYYHQSFFNKIATSDYVNVLYADVSNDFFIDIDKNFGYGYDVIPTSVLKRNQAKLQARAIGYVAALYQLFWDTTHPPTITSTLTILPQASSYSVGQTISAQFTITNKSTTPITVAKLTVGGRDPNGQVVDFPAKTGVILQPNMPYKYEGNTLTLTQTGVYHFFPAYSTFDGNWNTAIPAEFGITQYTLDSPLQISVVTDTALPTVSLTAPINGSTVSGSVAMAATATDNLRALL